MREILIPVHQKCKKVNLEYTNCAAAFKIQLLISRAGRKKSNKSPTATAGTHFYLSTNKNLVLNKQLYFFFMSSEITLITD